jgi:hypothetical protein
MSRDEAMATIRDPAASFSNGETDLNELWSAFHSNLHSLCRDTPLHGDTVRLFLAMERWEVAVVDERGRALDEVREAARRVASPQP